MSIPCLVASPPTKRPIRWPSAGHRQANPLFAGAGAGAGRVTGAGGGVGRVVVPAEERGGVVVGLRGPGAGGPATASAVLNDCLSLAAARRPQEV